VRQRLRGSCSALLNDMVFMPALAGVSVKEVEWWLRHGVATLGVRERTATRASLGGHHGTQKISSSNIRSLCEA
jgi:hypothetical protein